MAVTTRAEHRRRINGRSQWRQTEEDEVAADDTAGIAFGGGFNSEFCCRMSNDVIELYITASISLRNRIGRCPCN